MLFKNRMSSVQFVLMWALVTVVYNYLFILKMVESTNLWVGCLTIFVLFLGFVVAYAILLQKYVAKYVMAFFIVGNTAAVYFMHTYNIAIDKIMMINVFQTDTAEAGALLSVNMLVFVFVAAVLLICLVRSRIDYATWQKDLLSRVKLIVLSVVLLALILLPVAGKLDTFVQERKHLLYMLVPSNYIGSTIGAIKVVKKHGNLKPLDKKAELNRYWKQNGRKNLFVVVVGESVRADSYALNGYERDANKYLQEFAKDMMVFKHAKACGTSTAISVPCMFSPYGQKDFVPGSASYVENVLDVFNYNGYKAIWRENNSSCKGNCSRIITEIFCQDNSCMDGLMQNDLKEKLEEINDNAIVVLHQYGSHGPDYFKRYPKEFEIYKPVCQKEILKDCSYDEIRNAYDNSVVYNSYLAAEMLKDLQELDDKYNVVVFYTSDHGESLGENGVYLHAAVYKYAPHYQTEVPFWIWMPQKTKQNMNYDEICLSKQSERQISHDNLFHSLLGVSGLKIDAYDENLDVFAPCRNNNL